MSVYDTNLDSVLVRCSRRIQESITRTRPSHSPSSDQYSTRDMADGFDEHNIDISSDSLSMALSSSSASTALLSARDCCSDIRMPSNMKSTTQVCSRRNTARPLVGLGTSILYILMVLTLASTQVTASMHITAFEYQHKFNKTLELGECPQRELVNPRSGTYKTYRIEGCSLVQAGTAETVVQPLTYYRNVLIGNASAIVKYIGLCGGEAASYLGILNKGDCVAVEIANKLIFSEKTMVRAFVGHFRKSYDFLESSATVIRPGMEYYYNDKYFLKNRSYGTIEIIFVQFRFESEKAKEEAMKIELRSPLMSQYMKEIKERVETPTKASLISLSTSSQSPLKLKKFDQDNWDRAVRDVEIMEMGINKTMDKIISGEIKPHLEYEFYPFIASAVYRNANPLTWENVSMWEVSLEQALKQAKRTVKLCQGNRTKPCRRIRALRRSLKETLAEVHIGRSNWVTMTMEQKSAFLNLYSSKATNYINLTESLSKQIRLMKKDELVVERTRKMNELNQIPNTGMNFETSMHRIRHSQNKLRSSRIF